MKLLLVSNTYPPADISGVGSLVFELAREARRSGVDVRVLTRRVVGSAGPDLVATGGAKLLFPLLAVWAFFRRLRSWRPTVVHVHESDGVLIVLLLRLARFVGRSWGGCRIVATLQVSYTMERHSVRPIRTNGRVLSRPTASELIFAWLRAPLLSLLGRLTVLLADAVIAPSVVTAGELRRDYGARCVTVIPNGVLGVSIECSPRPGSILFVGRLRTRKAVAVLLEAMAELARRKQEAHLVVVGSGEQAEGLARLSLQLGLGDTVDLVGAISRAEIEGYYASAAVFCLPSLYEGLPVVILEAMSAGLPVVSTTVSGIPEAVDDERTGLLVAPEDSQALADALARVLSDSTMRLSMGRSGRQRYERRFAIGAVAAAHLALFEELAEEASQASPD